VSFTIRTKRELLSKWLWEMYARACKENKPEQARTISLILATMTRAEHPVQR
jgi:hypothetical protein